jgi:VanZ family protein
MSSIPGDSDIFTRGILINLIPTVQNLLHVPLFGLLAFLWIITFKLWSHTEKLSVGVAALISVSYGFLDEVYQYFVPGRYMSFTDVYLDILGVFSAIGIYKLVFKKRISTFEHSIN